jgi:hypothetical protein
MEKYKIVRQEDLDKLVSAFSSVEEYVGFESDLEALTKILKYLKPHEKTRSEVRLTQLLVFAAFCREHFELIKGLISNLHFTEMTQEEIDQLDIEKAE